MITSNIEFGNGRKFKETIFLVNGNDLTNASANSISYLEYLTRLQQISGDQEICSYFSFCLFLWKRTELSSLPDTILLNHLGFI